MTIYLTTLQNGPYNNLFNEGIARMDVKEGMTEYYNTMYRGMMEMLENMDFAAPYVPKLVKSLFNSEII